MIDCSCEQQLPHFCVIFSPNIVTILYRHEVVIFEGEYAGSYIGDQITFIATTVLFSSSPTSTAQSVSVFVCATVCGATFNDCFHFLPLEEETVQCHML